MVFFLSFANKLLLLFFYNLNLIQGEEVKKGLSIYFLYFLLPKSKFFPSTGSFDRNIWLPDWFSPRIPLQNGCNILCLYVTYWEIDKRRFYFMTSTRIVFKRVHRI